MALNHFGFIVTGDSFQKATGTDNFRMDVVGVKRPKEGIEVAKKMVEDGVQLIELCGGFGPVWTGRIIEAIEGKVPVGSVSYGPESIQQMYELFSS